MPKQPIRFEEIKNLLPTTLFQQIATILDQYRQAVSEDEKRKTMHQGFGALATASLGITATGLTYWWLIQKDEKQEKLNQKNIIYKPEQGSSVLNGVKKSENTLDGLQNYQAKSFENIVPPKVYESPITSIGNTENNNGLFDFWASMAPEKKALIASAAVGGTTLCLSLGLQYWFKIGLFKETKPEHLAQEENLVKAVVFMQQKNVKSLQDEFLSFSQGIDIPKNLLKQITDFKDECFQFEYNAVLKLLINPSLLFLMQQKILVFQQEIGKYSLKYPKLSQELNIKILTLQQILLEWQKIEKLDFNEFVKNIESNISIEIEENAGKIDGQAIHANVAPLTYQLPKPNRTAKQTDINTESSIPNLYQHIKNDLKTSLGDLVTGEILEEFSFKFLNFLVQASPCHRNSKITKNNLNSTLFSQDFAKELEGQWKTLQKKIPENSKKNFKNFKNITRPVNNIFKGVLVSVVFEGFKNLLFFPLEKYRADLRDENYLQLLNQEEQFICNAINDFLTKKGYGGENLAEKINNCLHQVADQSTNIQLFLNELTEFILQQHLFFLAQKAAVEIEQFETNLQTQNNLNTANSLIYTFSLLAFATGSPLVFGGILGAGLVLDTRLWVNQHYLGNIHESQIENQTVDKSTSTLTENIKKFIEEIKNLILNNLPIISGQRMQQWLEEQSKNSPNLLNDPHFQQVPLPDVLDDFIQHLQQQAKMQNLTSTLLMVNENMPNIRCQDLESLTLLLNREFDKIKIEHQTFLEFLFQNLAVDRQNSEFTIWLSQQKETENPDFKDYKRLQQELEKESKKINRKLKNIFISRCVWPNLKIENLPAELKELTFPQAIINKAQAKQDGIEKKNRQQETNSKRLNPSYVSQKLDPIWEKYGASLQENINEYQNLKAKFDEKKQKVSILEQKLYTEFSTQEHRITVGAIDLKNQTRNLMNFWLQVNNIEQVFENYLEDILERLQESENQNSMINAADFKTINQNFLNQIRDILRTNEIQTLAEEQKLFLNLNEQKAIKYVKYLHEHLRKVKKNQKIPEFSYTLYFSSIFSDPQFISKIKNSKSKKESFDLSNYQKEYKKIKQQHLADFEKKFFDYIRENHEKYATYLIEDIQNVAEENQTADPKHVKSDRSYKDLLEFYNGLNNRSYKKFIDKEEVKLIFSFIYQGKIYKNFEDLQKQLLLITASETDKYYRVQINYQFKTRSKNLAFEKGFFASEDKISQETGFQIEKYYHARTHREISKLSTIFIQKNIENKYYFELIEQQDFFTDPEIRFWIFDLFAVKKDQEKINSGLKNLQKKYFNFEDIELDDQGDKIPNTFREFLEFLLELFYQKENIVLLTLVLNAMDLPVQALNATQILYVTNCCLNQSKIHENTKIFDAKILKNNSGSIVISTAEMHHQAVNFLIQKTYNLFVENPKNNEKNNELRPLVLEETEITTITNTIKGSPELKNLVSAPNPPYVFNLATDDPLTQPNIFIVVYLYDSNEQSRVFSLAQVQQAVSFLSNHKASGYVEFYVAETIFDFPEILKKYEQFLTLMNPIFFKFLQKQSGHTIFSTEDWQKLNELLPQLLPLKYRKDIKIDLFLTHYKDYLNNPNSKLIFEEKSKNILIYLYQLGLHFSQSYQISQNIQEKSVIFIDRLKSIFSFIAQNTSNNAVDPSIYFEENLNYSVMKHIHSSPLLTQLQERFQEFMLFHQVSKMNHFLTRCFPDLTEEISRKILYLLRENPNFNIEFLQSELTQKVLGALYKWIDMKITMCQDFMKEPTNSKKNLLLTELFNIDLSYPMSMHELLKDKKMSSILGTLSELRKRLLVFIKLEVLKTIDLSTSYSALQNVKIWHLYDVLQELERLPKVPVFYVEVPNLENLTPQILIKAANQSQDQAHRRLYIEYLAQIKHLTQPISKLEFIHGVEKILQTDIKFSELNASEQQAVSLLSTSKSPWISLWVKEKFPDFFRNESTILLPNKELESQLLFEYLNFILNEKYIVYHKLFQNSILRQETSEKIAKLINAIDPSNQQSQALFKNNFLDFLFSNFTDSKVLENLPQNVRFLVVRSTQALRINLLAYMIRHIDSDMANAEVRTALVKLSSLLQASSSNWLAEYKILYRDFDRVVQSILYLDQKKFWDKIINHLKEVKHSIMFYNYLKVTRCCMQIDANDNFKHLLSFASLFPIALVKPFKALSQNLYPDIMPTANLPQVYPISSVPKKPNPPLIDLTEDTPTTSTSDKLINKPLEHKLTRIRDSITLYLDFSPKADQTIEIKEEKTNILARIPVYQCATDCGMSAFDKALDDTLKLFLDRNMRLKIIFNANIFMVNGQIAGLYGRPDLNTSTVNTRQIVDVNYLLWFAKSSSAFEQVVTLNEKPNLSFFLDDFFKFLTLKTQQFLGSESKVFEFIFPALSADQIAQHKTDPYIPLQKKIIEIFQNLTDYSYFKSLSFSIYQNNNQNQEHSKSTQNSATSTHMTSTIVRKLFAVSQPVDPHKNKNKRGNMDDILSTASHSTTLSTASANATLPNSLISKSTPNKKNKNNCTKK